MSTALLITVGLHDTHYHGAGEWPPSPARLFQALVAGVGLSGPLGAREREALVWLEGLEPPIIAAPPMWEGRSFRIYVPNNDLDSVHGDLLRVGKIRTDKGLKPRLVDKDVPFMYAWPLDGGENNEYEARVLCDLAECLYQFGRGIDMAWAWGDVVDGDELETRLGCHPGRIYRPSRGGNGILLARPEPGSLASLERRHRARRFRTAREDRSFRRTLTQAPKPRFAPVAYESPPSRGLYELRAPTAKASLVAWPLARSSEFITRLRDGVVERLRRALPNRCADIERFLVGRKADGRDEGPTSARVKIVPLPSIGHNHADRAIRRVLVEVPSDCPLRAEDVLWAFSGLEPVNVETGEMLGAVITPADDQGMLAHYGVGEDARFRVWRTVTPAALSENARQRNSTQLVRTQTKDVSERLAKHEYVAADVVQALRHAGVRQRAETIRVQREPFEANGERAEEFSPGSRFAEDRLWHVEIAFAEPPKGPLIIGDGRFLGLGVMRPVMGSQDIHAFTIEDGLSAGPQPIEAARALRRAVMARVQRVLGNQARLPAFFTGHERSGSPVRRERSSHLIFLFDPGSLRAARLLIVAPHVAERRSPTRDEAWYLEVLEDALTEFRELRAGSSGRLMLRPCEIDTHSDPLFMPSRIWESLTPYQVTRHRKGVGATKALIDDLRAECRRRGLPRVRVKPREPRGIPGVGLVGEAVLTFRVAVTGPLILGRSLYLGGGIFVGRPTSPSLENSSEIEGTIDPASDS